MIHLGRMLDLLRRHVLRRAHDLARVGQIAGRARSPLRAVLRRAEDCPPYLRTIFARPKSATFTRPRRSSRMFSGLMSRWTMPWSWANWSASQICGTMASASRGATRLPAQQLPQVHAVHELHQDEVE